jgi:hypothetical protein
MKTPNRNQTRVFDLFGELKPPLQARQSELNKQFILLRFNYLQAHKTD